MGIWLREYRKRNIQKHNSQWAQSTLFKNTHKSKRICCCFAPVFLLGNAINKQGAIVLHIFSPSIIRGKQKLVVKETAALCSAPFILPHSPQGCHVAGTAFICKGHVWTDSVKSVCYFHGLSKCKGPSFHLWNHTGHRKPLCEVSCLTDPGPTKWGFGPDKKAVAQGKRHPAGDIPIEHCMSKDSQADPVLCSDWPSTWWALACHITGIY